MLDRDEMVKVEHIYREGNQLVDFLVCLGHNLSIGVHSIPISGPMLFHHVLYYLDFLSLVWS
ncbi:hypothetical protein LINPERHAP2_LOCUS32596 [Linum perenne]